MICQGINVNTENKDVSELFHLTESGHKIQNVHILGVCVCVCVMPTREHH